MVNDNGWGAIPIEVHSWDNVVVNNTANANGGYGIYLENGQGGAVTGNRTNGNGAWGIKLLGWSDTALEGNTANGNPYGIWLDATSNLTVNSNTACYNSAYDFLVSGGGAGNTGIDNTCDEPDGWNDEGTTGCTYPCPHAVEPVRSATVPSGDHGGCRVAR